MANAHGIGYLSERPIGVPRVKAEDGFVAHDAMRAVGITPTALAG